MTAAEMVNRLRWLGYLIIEPGMGDVPRVDVGQIWVSLRRNVENREVLQIGSYPTHPATGDRIIAFRTPTRGHDGSPCLLEEGKFILWARRMGARPTAPERMLEARHHEQ